MDVAGIKLRNYFWSRDYHSYHSTTSEALVLVTFAATKTIENGEKMIISSRVTFEAAETISNNHFLGHNEQQNFDFQSFVNDTTFSETEHY